MLSTTAIRAQPAAEDFFADEVPGATPLAVIGYTSIDSPDRQRLRVDSRRQAERIAAECEHRGLRLIRVVQERPPRRGPALERPALGYALGQISAGEAGGLVVVELSRLARSMAELGRVLEWFSRSGARLVAAATGLDTEEEGGRLALRSIIEVATWERQRLGERTRNGMRAAKRNGLPGVADDPELAERISRMRADGMTLQAIADRLNAAGVPTVRGGLKWRPSSVQAAAGYRRPASRRPPQLVSVGGSS